MAVYRVAVFSGAPPAETFHLLERLTREVPGVEIAGLLCERQPAGHPGKSLCSRGARAAGHALLRFAQASGVAPSGDYPSSDAELGERCRRLGCELLTAAEFDAAANNDFVRSCRADLGIAVGARFTPAAVFRLPRLGTIFARLLSSGAAPWPLRLLVTVCRTTDRPETAVAVRSRSFRTDPFDTPVSVGLKSALLGEDLLLEVMRDFSRGASPRSAQLGHAATVPPPLLAKRGGASRHFQAPRTRPVWKLLLRSSAYLWLLPMRNWVRRLRRRFPLVILCHHLVSDQPHPMGISTEGFLEQLRYLKRHYRLVRLREGLELLASGRMEQPTAVLTFDDGYEDNFLTLRAVLRVEPAPITLFVCPELSEKGKPFPHDERDLREGFGPLTPAQMQRLAAEGFEIGSHTRTHFNCGSTDRGRLEGEIAGSRRDLESLLGRPVAFFAFPWGKPANMSAPALEIAETNYEYFFSACGGANFPGRTGRHLLRTAHPHSLWELELALQQLLEFHPTGEYHVAPSAAAPGGNVPVSETARSSSGVNAAGQTQ